MPCHGFAQSLAWQEVSASVPFSVELRDSSWTRARYPFGFRLRATYELAERRLTITYAVTADSANSGPMPFSIGNHMTFRLPFLKGTDPGDMLFETPSTA